MIILVLTVCLAGSPTDCKDVNLTFMTQYASQMQCMRYGQGEIAKWSTEHPGWTLKKWRCVSAKILGRVT